MADLHDPTEEIRETVSRYAEPLLRLVAGRLFKPRIGQPLEELAEKTAETQLNAPVIDRRMRELPETAKLVLMLFGISRRHDWKIGHLITLAAANGRPEGFLPVQQLLEAGLVFPRVRATDTAIEDFPAWLGTDGMLSAVVYLHPAVAARARGLALELVPPSPTKKTSAASAPVVPPSDGLEWPLRLMAVWQILRGGAMRVTQAGTLFKRDLVRLQSEPIVATPFADAATVVPDPGLLTFEWSTAAGLLHEEALERTAVAPPEPWQRGLWPTLSSLYAAFFAIETWDPQSGYHVHESGISAVPTTALQLMAILSRQEATHWTNARELAEKLWEFHPAWPSTLSKDAQRDYGTTWVVAFFEQIALPLRIVEAHAEDRTHYRLSEFGRHVTLGCPEPTAPAIFPQTLVVQPNAEVLAYRQGLTPSLLAKLSSFATWKQIGAACTLELNAEETYRGLEGGLTIAEITQTLDRFGVRSVPPNVVDLLRRWANKRERVTVYSSATLAEFATPADLDSALGRGLVAIRLTDRIGLTADGTDPEFKHLRLIGNRDYDAKPVRCVTIADDGVTLMVDAAQSDLLLEAEMVRLAEPIASETASVRKFRMSPESVRRALALGTNLEEFDRWFISRAGLPMPAAGRLFVIAAKSLPLIATRKLVVQLPTDEIADGIMQWPETRQWIHERLGPTAVVIEQIHYATFVAKVESLGLVAQLLES